MPDPTPAASRTVVVTVTPVPFAGVRPAAADPNRPRTGRPYSRSGFRPKPTGRPAPQFDADRIARSTAAAGVRFV